MACRVRLLLYTTNGEKRPSTCPRAGSAEHHLSIDTCTCPKNHTHDTSQTTHDTLQANVSSPRIHTFRPPLTRLKQKIHMFRYLSFEPRAPPHIHAWKRPTVRDVRGMSMHERVRYTHSAVRENVRARFFSVYMWRERYTQGGGAWICAKGVVSKVHESRREICSGMARCVWKRGNVRDV